MVQFQFYIARGALDKKIARSSLDKEKPGAKTIDVETAFLRTKYQS